MKNKSIETHIKKLFSSDEMKKCPDKYRDDNQILNTFLEETKEYKGKGKIKNIR